MKKGRTWITFVTIVFVAIIWIILMTQTDEWRQKKYQEREARAKKYNEWVGERVSFRPSDTLKVVEYDKWKNKFTLEDESKLSPEGVEKLMIK